MYANLPDYIVYRVRRRTPVNSGVVPGSTPVLSFGNAQSATTATLGLNPSRREFLDDNGAELTGSSRRLATLQSLGLEDVSRASEGAIRQVVEDCSAYFQRNPYRRWFDQLESVLRAVGASYYGRSACHLDLVQWATDPTWRRLPRSAREQLLEADGAFLLQQLRNEHIRLLLVNGMTPVRQLERLASLTLVEQHRLSACSYQPTRLFVGNVFDRILVVGWSTNLQSSFGVTNVVREQLADRVAEIVALTRVA
jgi:hypothetical protein